MHLNCPDKVYSSDNNKMLKLNLNVPVGELMHLVVALLLVWHELFSLFGPVKGYKALYNSL